MLQISVYNDTQHTHTTHLIHCIHRSTLLYKILGHILVTTPNCKMKRGPASLTIIRGSIRMFEWMCIRVCVCVCVFEMHVTTASGEDTWKKDTTSTSQCKRVQWQYTEVHMYLRMHPTLQAKNKRTRPQQQREQRQMAPHMTPIMSMNIHKLKGWWWGTRTKRSQTHPQQCRSFTLYSFGCPKGETHNSPYPASQWKLLLSEVSWQLTVCLYKKPSEGESIRPVMQCIHLNGCIEVDRSEIQSVRVHSCSCSGAKCKERNLGDVVRGIQHMNTI